MKYGFLSAILLLVAVAGCEKEQNRKLLDAYFKYTINGAETTIKDEGGLSDNVFDCTIQGDTLLLINVAKFYEGAGFYVKSDSIKNGTYTLDSINRAYYTNPKDNIRYRTNGTYKGSLTIVKDTFQAKTVINVLKGEFSFKGVDTASGKTFTLTKGSFLMERKD